MFFYLMFLMSFKEQKAQGIFGETFFFFFFFFFGIIVLSCLSSTRLLICETWEIKNFYQSSLGNEVDFRDIMNITPNILAKN